MGLSIHYKGRIRDYTAIDSLVAETADLCNSLDWPWQVFDTDKSLLKPGDRAEQYSPYDVKGISFNPPGCETTFLTFLPDGILCSPLALIFYEPQDKESFIEVVHTKTQYAGPEVHVALIRLLRYLSEKYFESFHLDDEGYYWETNDKQVLKEQFAAYHVIFESLSHALENLKPVPGESAESLADRIEEILKEKFNGVHSRS